MQVKLQQNKNIIGVNAYDFNTFTPIFIYNYK